MEKEKFFSKFNITDYNNELEDILEKKSFSEGVKNILLNILYKIETAYEDYNKVKVETDNKKDILEEIINIIEKKCKGIELIKPKLDEETVLKDKKFIEKKNKIISYPNEKTVYYGLCHFEEDKFKINKEYTIIKEPMEKLLNLGYIFDLEEVIRDFDGWAWNKSLEDIENYTYNLAYQNLKILVGQRFIHESITNMNKTNFIEKLEKKLDSLYSEKVSNKIKESIYQISILEYILEDDEKKNMIIQEQKQIKLELDKITNKKEYLQELANKKKDITKKIKPIDEALNNNKIIRKKFKEENEKLKENEKIFSLSEYIEVLQERRRNLLKELGKLNNLMKPMNYVKNKFNLQKKNNILKKIEFDNNDINEINKQKDEIILDLQISFLKALQEKISKTETKKRIIEYVYIFRYYKMLYLNSEIQIKDIEKLKKQLKITERYLITRCCNLKLINIFSNNIEKNYELISKILESNIIDLDELNIEFTKKEGKIILNIFDDNMIDKTIEYNEDDEINVKLGKKIKLFI